MSVTFEDGVIWLTDACAIEEAETLAVLVAQHPDAVVDLSLCRLAHTAVLEVLIAFAPAMRGDFNDPFLTLWVRPGLEATARRNRASGPANL
jgi:hypothetical protein